MKFWQELRRRRVYRLAGLYILGAWAVIQVADISFPAWGVPDSALRYLFFAAAACFPIALIFSWFYDITPKGIVRTEAADGSESVDLKLKRGDYIVLAALLGVGLAILFGSADRIQREIETEPVTTIEEAGWKENSIAVLPFTNLDINPDTGFFCDGITEEILYRLSSLGALHVLASNSSFALRDSKESPAQIRAKLGVRYLLQGSIRRENDYVRIVARLIDEGGFQVWSESFDRKLEGIFTIQTEIASTVASQIINEIVPMQELPAGRTTTNMEAYNEYLVGKTLLDSRPGNWREPAEAAFRKAIELDPGFAPPYAGLAMAITVNTLWGPNWEEGRQLADKAIELDPDFALGHAALALSLFAKWNVLAEGSPEESVLSSRRALELDPSMGFAYNILASTLETMGQDDEARAVMEKGLSVDPLNVPIVANIAGRESREGNFERAEQLLLRLLSLPQPPKFGLVMLYGTYDAWGRFADAVVIAKRYVRLFASPDDLEGFIWLAWVYGNLGMTGEADFWKNLVLEYTRDELENLDFTYNLLRTRNADSELGEELRQLVNNSEFREGEHDPWMLARFGLVNIQLGDFEKGSEQLEYGLRLRQGNANGNGPADSIDVMALRADPADTAYVLHLLAFAYQQVGRSDDANALLLQLTDVFGMENSALHQALTGDTAGALEVMRSTMENGIAEYYGPGKYYEIINDPAWAGTIKTPEFQELLAGVKEEVDRQRAIVEAIDAKDDFRAEAAQLLAK
jgi:TolB-like protein/Flp pilus assembly protein TadD